MAKRLLTLGAAAILLVMLVACAPAATSPTPASQATAKPATTTAPAAATAAATAAKPAASSPTAAAKAAPKTLEKVKYMSPTAGISFLPGFFGKEKGIFAEEGLDPEWIVIKAELGIPALLTGDVDYAGLLEPALQAFQRGEQVKFLMSMKSKASWRIIVGKGINSVQDLKGKALALDSLGSTNQYATEKGLASLGLDPKEVTFVVIRAPETMAAMQSGTIAATGITPPYSNILVQAGYKELLNTASVVPIATTGVATSVKKLQQNPDQVKRLLRGFLKSLAYIRDHKEEAIEFSMKQYDMTRDIAEATIAGAIEEYSYDGSVSDKALEATLEMMKRNEGPWKDANLEILKKGMDAGPVTQVQKELGLVR